MVNQNKVVIVTQARIGSTRFPKKIMQNLGGKTLIDHHLDRLLKVENKDKVIVATTKEDGIEELISLLRKKNLGVYQGSTDNVLDRFYNAVKNESPDYVVRVTSDCPLIDPKLIEEVIAFTIENELDYGANILKELFPDGQDIEVFKFSALNRTFYEATLNSDREHVTPYIRRNSSFLGGKLFKSDNYYCEKDFNGVRMTVDEKPDLEACEIMIERLGDQASWKEYTEFIIKNQSLFSNQKIKRNEGFEKSLKND